MIGYEGFLGKGGIEQPFLLVSSPGILYSSFMNPRVLSVFLVSLALLFHFLSGAAALETGMAPERMIMDRWDDLTGLPSNNVLDVLQDGAGYVWLASYDGLIRFDGKNFTVYTKGSGDGFSSNSARALVEGPDGTVWVGTNTDGLFACRNGAFTAYGTADGLPDLSIRALGFDRSGKLWVGTAGGLAVFGGDGTFTPVGSPAGISTFLQPLNDGSMISGTNRNGLLRTGGSGLELWNPALIPAFSERSFTAALEDDQNRLWLGTASGDIFVLQGSTLLRQFELPELKGGTVKDFIVDGEGTVWIATDKGLAYGGLKGFTIFSEENGLPNNSVTSLWLDREKSLWAGTDRGGIVKFSSGKFLNLTTREGLKGNAVNSVVEDRYGSLWVGSDQGLAFLPSIEDPYGISAERNAAVDRVLADIGSARVRQIRLDDSGALWFSTYSNFGLYRFDGTTGRSISTEKGLSVNRFRLSLEDSRGRIWGGTSAGLCLVDEGRIFTRADGLKNEFILGLFEDSENRLWIGLDGGGLARLERDGTFSSWTAEDGLAGNVVFRIFEDSDKRLWVCTSDGLSLISPDGRFTTYRTTDGLLSDSVYELMQDPVSGDFWLITSRGIAVFSPELLVNLPRGGMLNKNRIRVLNRLDGLAGQPAANSWAFIDPQGVFFLPTIGGLSIYNPQSVALNPTPPPVYVEQVTIDGETKRVPAGQEIEIDVPAGTRRVSIGFTALSFVIPQKVGFSYALEGYDRDPIATYGERVAVYTNLPPGKYSFHVSAWNNDGVENPQGAAVVLRVHPHFWETTPFQILVAACLLALGYLATLARVRVITRRRDRLEKLVSLRTADLLKERERSESLLLNVLPAHVAAELKYTGKAEPRVHPGVTVYVADIVGFTEKSAALSPAATIEALNAIFGAFDEIMDRFGCERIKTVGDAYIAVARLTPGEGSSGTADDAARLASAALETLSWLDSYRKESAFPWEIRIGMHSGPVVGGVVGIKKYIFDVFGDTVNIAFRLQSISAPGEITVSRETAGLLEGRFLLASKGVSELKGKGGMEILTLKGPA